MKVKIINGRVCGVPLKEFPAKYVEHHDGILQKTKISTICLEIIGKGILEKCPESDSAEAVAPDFCKELGAFIDQIVAWGVQYGPNTICGDDLTPGKIRKICQAAAYLQENNLELAIKTLDNSQGRGVKGMRVTVGSKILRMMSPEKAGAFDRVLRENLSEYTKEAFCAGAKNEPDAFHKAYPEFCKDCKVVADKLNAKGIKHKPSITTRRSGSHKWLAADVEAVVFHHLR